MAKPSTRSIELACEIELSCSCEVTSLLCPAHEAIALALDAVVAELEGAREEIREGFPERDALYLQLAERGEVIAAKDVELRLLDALLAHQEYVEDSAARSTIRRAIALTPDSVRERADAERRVIEAAKHFADSTDPDAPTHLFDAVDALAAIQDRADG